jgi:hypothetical protein
MYSLHLAALALLSALLVAALTLPLEAGEARASGNTFYPPAPATVLEFAFEVHPRFDRFFFND